MNLKHKILFLDIDGVLNVYCEGRDKFGCTFHKHFEDNLRNIIEKTKAKIVISSTWKSDGLKRLKDMWEFRNLAGEVIDITPSQVDSKLISKIYDGTDRGYEIQQYLNDHPEIENYCIIDDDSDMMKSQMNNFVKTSENSDHPDCVDIGYGLTKICSEEVIKILNRE